MMSRPNFGGILSCRSEVLPPRAWKSRGPARQVCATSLGDDRQRRRGRGTDTTFSGSPCGIMSMAEQASSVSLLSWLCRSSSTRDGFSLGEGILWFHIIVTTYGRLSIVALLRHHAANYHHIVVEPSVLGPKYC